jgi:hypothetical protein
MDPVDDPEEFIAASIYWYPGIFPTRTEVLDHTLLCNGNGYEWGSDGKIRSVFAHIDPHQDDDCIARELRDADAEEAKERQRGYQLPPEASFAAWHREQAAELQAVRDDYLRRARTYGPVRVREQVPGPGNADGYQARMITSWDLGWTLLGRAPAYVAPVWRPYLAEVRELFAPVLVEQGTLWGPS